MEILKVANPFIKFTLCSEQLPLRVFLCTFIDMNIYHSVFMLTFGSFSFTAIAFLIVIETQASQDLLKLSFRCYKNAYIALHRTRSLPPCGEKLLILPNIYAYK